jgi:hypothetical protein
VTPGFTLAYRASRFEIGTLMLDRILQPWLVYSELTLSSLLILVGLGMRALGGSPTLTRNRAPGRLDQREPGGVLSGAVGGHVAAPPRAENAGVSSADH